MVSDITHQLKTPITNIKMYGETLCEENLSKNEERQFIQIILQQVDKLEFLIESLAEMSRLESKMLHMHPENCKLIQTVSRALDTVRSRADEKKMELQVDVRPTIEVSHDSKWTAEALGNILDNAVKYTQSGGKITVSARNLEMYVVISISDNGIGIDPGHYNRIFQRFYREAKAAKTEGLGIGLYLARQIITLQGGYIKVRSKEGYGTELKYFFREGRHEAAFLRCAKHVSILIPFIPKTDTGLREWTSIIRVSQERGIHHEYFTDKKSYKVLRKRAASGEGS